jgi:hypothetical protein
MDEATARKILGATIMPDNDLHGDDKYISWGCGAETCCLDDDFTADELEAIAWWMKRFKR